MRGEKWDKIRPVGTISRDVMRSSIVRQYVLTISVVTQTIYQASGKGKGGSLSTTLCRYFHCLAKHMQVREGATNISVLIKLLYIHIALCFSSYVSRFH